MNYWIHYDNDEYWNENHGTATNEQAINMIPNNAKIIEYKNVPYILVEPFANVRDNVCDINLNDE